MLPKINRLHRTEINDLKQRRKQVLQGKYFGLVFQNKEDTFRVGLIISGNISKKAVERNRVKRLLYRVIENKLMGVNGLFLFLAKRNCVEASLIDLEKEIESFKSKIA